MPIHIQDEPIIEKNWLQCPGCGDGALHHAGLVSYDRVEDAAETMVTELRPDGSLSRYPRASQFTENPSSRRDGIAIRFWCEQCWCEQCSRMGRDPADLPDPPAAYELTISQHKGGTYLCWREAVPFRGR